MKHYMDIEHIKENTEFLKANTDGFRVGDKITITEKIDGANASFRYDEETGKLVCFSRKQELNEMNTLRGFWNWVQELDVYPFRKNEWGAYIFFGEWLVSHTVQYNKEAYNKFYLFDIYDTVNGEYLPYYTVQSAARMLGLETVPYLYIGPFISWDHCRTFIHKPSYGETQEGIVVRNEQRRNDEERLPHTLKIVNADFKETAKRKEGKKDDSEKVAARNSAQALVETVVTPARVKKMIHKLIDEGVLPEQLSAQDMKLVAQNLPRAIYHDCVKEEPETMRQMGEYAGKMCGSLTMKLARDIILGM